MLSCWIIGLAINIFIGQLVFWAWDELWAGESFDSHFRKDMKDPGFWLFMPIAWSTWSIWVLVLLCATLYKFVSGLRSEPE